MTSKILQELLKSTAFLGVLLLIGLYLRAKISLFRRFLVPASVIGGFLGLLLGPEVLGLTGYSPISPEWNKTWSLLAGILVVPMFAGIPLGNFVKKKRLDPQENRKEAAKIAIVSGIASGAFGFQIILGVGLPLLFMAFIPGLEFYNQFGYEICQGFNGGHGMAGAIGSLLMEGGASYWELSQGVLTTFATIGLLGGILLGVMIINRAAAKGETAFLKGSASLPTEDTYGFTKEINKQGQMGRETTQSAAIEPLTVHLAIILADCGLAYYLLGGILLGVMIINRAAAKGETAFLKGSASLPTEDTYGFTKEINKQGQMGRETTQSAAIEPLTVHLAIILADCGLAYYLRGLFVKYQIIGLQDVPVWPYALLLMYAVNYGIQKLHLEWMIDVKIKNHICGIFADFSIIAAIASMPIRAVLDYILPILVISAAGFVLVYYTTIKMFQYFLPDSYPFERGILSFGINTGVMMTGATLLKICDPNFDSPVMTDYSLSYAIRQVIELVSTPIMYAILVKGTAMDMLKFGIIYTVCCYLIAFIGKKLYGSPRKEKMRETVLAE